MLKNNKRKTNDTWFWVREPRQPKCAAFIVARVGSVQYKSNPGNNVLDRADYTVSARQHKLDHTGTDQESVCPDLDHHEVGVESLICPMCGSVNQVFKFSVHHYIDPETPKSGDQEAGTAGGVATINSSSSNIRIPAAQRSRLVDGRETPITEHTFDTNTLSLKISLSHTHSIVQKTK